MFTEAERVEICRMSDCQMSRIVEEAAQYMFDRKHSGPDMIAEFSKLLGEEPVDHVETLFAEWMRYAAIYDKASLGTPPRGKELFDDNLEFAVRRLERDRITA